MEHRLSLEYYRPFPDGIPAETMTTPPRIPLLSTVMAVTIKRNIPFHQSHLNLISGCCEAN